MRLLSLLLAISLAIPASAGTVSRIYDFQPHTKAQAEQVDAELDNLLATINGNIDSVNLNSAAVATANLATASVTHAKMGPLGHQVSGSSGNYERASAVEGLITNLTANITVVTRPVWVGLQPTEDAYSPGSISYRHGSGGATDNTAFISFRRAGLDGVQATRNMSAIVGRNITNSTNNTLISLPCSAFWFLDEPGAGPFGYHAYARVASGDDGFIKVTNCKLVVFEL